MRLPEDVRGIFNEDLSGWDVSQVKFMHLMFFGAQAFNGDISGWDVSQVTQMYMMFMGAKAFNRDISNWDVSQTININIMFSGASAFNQNLCKWRSRLPENCQVDRPFLDTSCPDATQPILPDGDSFCQMCSQTPSTGVNLPSASVPPPTQSPASPPTPPIVVETQSPASPPTPTLSPVGPPNNNNNNQEETTLVRINNVYMSYGECESLPTSEQYKALAEATERHLTSWLQESGETLEPSSLQARVSNVFETTNNNEAPYEVIMKYDHIDIIGSRKIFCTIGTYWKSGQMMFH